MPKLSCTLGDLAFKVAKSLKLYEFSAGGEMQRGEFGAVVENWQVPPKPASESLIGRYGILEPLSADRHAADLFAANSQSDLIWDYLPYGPFASLEEYRNWITSQEVLDDPYFYAVIDKKTGKALGVMSYLRINPEAGSIEVGHINWSIALQRTKLSTEALFLMMQWAFEAGYRRFEWKCNALNKGSCCAAERFGFSYEGIFRQAQVTKGRNRDTAWYACIDKEWPSLKAAYQTWLDKENFDQNGMQKQALSALTRAILVNHDPRLIAQG